MKTLQISNIDKILTKLPEKQLDAVKKYAKRLLEKGKKRKAFEKRVFKAEKESSIICNSVEEALVNLQFQPPFNQRESFCQVST